MQPRFTQAFAGEQIDTGTYGICPAYKTEDSPPTCMERFPVEVFINNQRCKQYHACHFHYGEKGFFVPSAFGYTPHVRKKPITIRIVNQEWERPPSMPPLLSENSPMAMSATVRQNICAMTCVVVSPFYNGSVWQRILTCPCRTERPGRWYRKIPAYPHR